MAGRIEPEAAAHCRRLVAESDPDRSVAMLFAPAERRDALLALYAFDIETSGIRDRISQPMPGEIRLQWWRDMIEAAGGPEAGGQGSPVAAALLAAIAQFDLPRAAFDRLLEARIFDVYDDPMPSREAFEAYAGETASAVIMLAGMILDPGAAPGLADIAGHAGVAQTAANVLRWRERHSSRSQVYVPADILEATATSPGDWLAGGDRAARAAAAMRAFGAEHQREVEARFPSVPASLRPALLPSLLTSYQLSDTGDAPIGPVRRSWTYWRAMRGRAPSSRPRRKT